MTFDQIAWYCSMTVSTTDFACPLHAVPWRPRPPNGSNASRVRVNNLLMVGFWKDRRWSKFCPISNIFTDSRCSCLTVFHGSWIALFLHLDFYTFLTTFLPTSTPPFSVPRRPNVAEAFQACAVHIARGVADKQNFRQKFAAFQPNLGPWPRQSRNNAHVQSRREVITSKQSFSAGAPRIPTRD